MGSFGISEGNITRRKKKQAPQNPCLTTTASGEIAQMLASATSELGLGREARVAQSALSVRPGPESPGDNLRELM